MNEGKILFQSELMVPPTRPNHLVNKKYVDEAIEGLRWDPVKAAATSNIAGTAGDKTLTGAANGEFPSVDGLTLAVGDRLLLWQQTDKTQNGLYVLTRQGDAAQPWILTRSGDADADLEFRPGKAVYVQPDGVLYGDTTFKQTTGTAVAVGGTAIEFALATADSVDAQAFDIVGDGSKSEFTITHTLGTRDVAIQIRDEQGVQCQFAVQVVSATAVTVAAGIPIPAGEKYRVVIIGKAD